MFGSKLENIIARISRNAKNIALVGSAVVLLYAGVACVNRSQSTPTPASEPTPIATPYKPPTPTPEQEFYESAREKLDEVVAMQVVSSLNKYDENAYEFVEHLHSINSLIPEGVKHYYTDKDITIGVSFIIFSGKSFK